MAARFRTPRRAFLRGLGAGTIAAPFLRTGAARGQDVEPRLIIFFSPNGTIREEFFPEGDGGSGFTLKRILSPLQDFRDRLLILDGVDEKLAGQGPGDGHQQGMTMMLTAREMLPGDTKGGCDSCPAAGWASGESIDQFIARQLPAGFPNRSIELGVQCGSKNDWGRMIYTGADQPVDPEESPYNAFSRLFDGLDTSGSGEPDPAALRRRMMKQSVLDFSRAEVARVRKNLGAENRARLDQHEQTLFELETELQATATPIVNQCTKPTFDQEVNTGSSSQFPRLVQQQIDVMVAAMMCGLTRVGSLQFTRSVSGMNFGFAGADVNHHSTSHNDEEPTARENLIKINTWYAQQFAYLLDRLSRVPEGDGTMLDNTMVLWVNELSRGGAHDRKRKPYVLAGNAGGYFNSGRHLKYGGASHSDLFVSIANAMGVQANSFGDPSVCHGPLSNLR